MFVSIILPSLSVFLITIQLVNGNKNLNPSKLTSNPWYVVSYEGPIVTNTSRSCMTVKITTPSSESIEAAVSYFTSASVSKTAMLEATLKTSKEYAIVLDATVKYQDDTSIAEIVRGSLQLRYYTSEFMYWKLTHGAMESNFILSRHRSLSEAEQRLSIYTDSTMKPVNNAKSSYCSADDLSRPESSVDEYGITGVWYVVGIKDDSNHFPMLLESWKITIEKSADSSYTGICAFKKKITKLRSEQQFNVSLYDYVHLTAVPIFNISISGKDSKEYHASRIDSYSHDLTYWKVFEGDDEDSIFLELFLSPKPTLSDEEYRAITGVFGDVNLKNISSEPGITAVSQPPVDSESTKSDIESTTEKPKSTTVEESIDDEYDNQLDDEESITLGPSKASGPSTPFLLVLIWLFYSCLR